MNNGEENDDATAIIPEDGQSLREPVFNEECHIFTRTPIGARRRWAIVQACLARFK